MGLWASLLTRLTMCEMVKLWPCMLSFRVSGIGWGRLVSRCGTSDSGRPLTVLKFRLLSMPTVADCFVFEGLAIRMTCRMLVVGRLLLLGLVAVEAALR